MTATHFLVQPHDAHRALASERTKCDNGNMKNLGSIRRERHLTQAQLAEAAGLNQATISKAERGQINLTSQTVEDLARVLRVHPGDLFGRDDLEGQVVLMMAKMTQDEKLLVLSLVQKIASHH